MDTEIEETKEKIAVMQAFVEDKKIQGKLKAETSWVTCRVPSWNWAALDYRVEPEPVEGWVNIYENCSSFFYPTKEKAEAGAIGPDYKRTVFVREVPQE